MLGAAEAPVHSFRGEILMRQKRRLLRSDRIARNLLWLVVILILVCAVLTLRNCHA